MWREFLPFYQFAVCSFSVILIARHGLTPGNAFFAAWRQVCVRERSTGGGGGAVIH